MKEKDNYLYILQVFRGFAAIMVVFHHLIRSISHFQNNSIPLLNFIGSIGKYGVDFFFILSGFIISYSVYNKKSNYNFKKYIINRIIRIYVPYLPIGIAMYLLYSLLPDFSESNRSISIIRSLTLFPIGNPALSVAWTLSFEMMFYLLFGLNFISHKLWNWFLGMWFISILLSKYVFFINCDQIIFFNPYNIEFMLGYMLSVMYLKNYSIKKIIDKRIIILFLVIFSSIFLISKYCELIIFPFYLNFLFSLLVFLGLYLSVFYYNKYQLPTLLILLGNASYSIYLVHNPVISMLARLFSRHHINFTLSILIQMMICCLIGYLYYFIFERKVMNIMKKVLVK